MRELERTRHIASGVDIGKLGCQEFVRDHRLGRVDANVFKTISRKPGGAPNGNDQAVEIDTDLRPLAIGKKGPVRDPDRTVIGQY